MPYTGLLAISSWQLVSVASMGEIEETPKQKPQAKTLAPTSSPLN